MAYTVSSPSFHSSSINSYSGPNLVSQQGVSGSDFVSAAGGYLFNRYGPAVVSAAQTRLDSVASGLINTISDGSGRSRYKGNGKGKPPSNGGPPSTPPKGGRRPSRSKIPFIGGSPDSTGIPQFSINTGIDSGIVVNSLQPCTDYYTPLFIQCGSLFPDEPIQTDSDVSNALNSTLYYKYLTIVQTEVNYGLSKEFSQINFYNYIRKISYALQLYYMIDSILAYTSHSPNNNLAMTFLRMVITPEISNAHIKLKEILESTSIPPRLLEFIRYMYQNYSFNDVNGSSIIRLSLSDSLCTCEYSGKLGISEDTYVRIIEDLINLSNINSIIRKIRPSWVSKLLPSSYEALYDPQFSTFWHNSNIAYEDFGSQATKFTISVKNNSENIYYGVFDNRLDGIIYASCSILDANSIMQKGLWKPFSNFMERKSVNSSLLYYCKDGLIRPITDVQFRNASMVFAAPYVEVTKDNNLIWVLFKSNFAGSCVPQVHTLENVTHSVGRSINWLLSPN